MEKEFWRSIAANRFQVPSGFTVEQLTPELISKLGERDPELRDYYIYTTLEKWIGEGLYTPAQLRNMIAQLTKNLRVGLGEQGTDSVLLRSFSALTLSEIVKYENRHPFLRAEEIVPIMEQSIFYLLHEQDLRAYVEGQGWIHAMAHAGDLLGVLARNRYVEERELERLLAALAEKVALPTTQMFVMLEEERLALVVVAALTRKVVRFSFWHWWLRQLEEVGEPLRWEDTVHFARQKDICAYHNTKLFLHALYFQLQLGGYRLPDVPDLVERITRTLYRLDPGFYSVEVMKILDPDIDTDQLHT
ncbi:MAG TPA: DUF2785 domain-containing protein [Ktedonobacteraceae bacterium]|nr:DUF2785 domain-containing protein [Ktedonobacteraceae bacterium]